jgi:UDP-glucose 4-epimerase
MVEHYLRLHCLHNGIEFGIARPGNAYGERQDPSGGLGAVAAFLGSIARSEPITVWGDGSVVRDYIYVKDLARALRLLVESPLRGGVFNIGSGIGTSISELIERLVRTTSVSPMVEYADGRAYDVPANVLDIRLAEQALGWRPLISMEEGLRRTWDWVTRLD